MLSRYAGVGAVCPQFTVTTDSGGSLTESGSLYFSFQLQNRAGFNVPSVSTQIDYAAGQKIIITIPDTVRKDGWDIHYFEISAGTTSDPSTHVAIARYSGYQFGDGIDPQSLLSILPATIELSRDLHIALAPTVASLAALPDGNDRLDGQVRYVLADTEDNPIGWWFEYRADSDQPTNSNVVSADVGQWVRVGNASTYVSSSTGAGGSDCALPSIEPTSIVPTPDYPGNTLEKTLPTWESRYCIYNDTDTNLPEGIEFGIQLEYNNRRSPALLAGLIFVSFLGFVKDDGTLRTTKISDNSEFYNIGGYVEWLPEIETNFLLPDDLLPTESILIAVKPCFSAAELDFYSDERSGSTGMSSGDIFGIKPAIITQPSSYSSLGLFLSSPNIVANRRDLLRIVPSTGLSYKALAGCAMVASRIFPIKPERIFSLQAQNTANQKIIVDTRGDFYSELNSYAIQSSETLRATVSTLSGESNIGDFSAYVANSGTSGFEITLNYPCNAEGLGTIRSDYPDVIAGNSKGSFNPYGVNIYIQRQDTLEIRRFTGNLVVPDVSQTFTINGWDSGVIASLPSVDFGLFAPNTSSLIVNDSGSFPATDYRVSYSFVYDGNQITDIDHSSPPCIYEWIGDLQPPSVSVVSTITVAQGTDASVVNIGTGNAAELEFYLPPGEVKAVADIAALTAIDPDFRTNGLVVAVQDSGDTTPKIYIFDSNATTGGVTPDTGTGRWIAATSSGSGGTGTDITRTSTTSNSIGTGSKTFTYSSSSNLGWLVGTRLRAANDISNYLEGSITAVSDSSITINSDNAVGSGTFTSWNITIAGDKGTIGATGATGSSGSAGATGAQGLPAYSNATASFVQPAPGSNVVAQIGNSDWAGIGTNVNVVSGGTYQVISKPNSTSIELQNLSSYSTNATSGTTISSGVLVTPTGDRGAAGATGSVSAASGLILNPASSITTGINEYGVYFDSTTGFPVYRFPSNGAIAILGNYQQSVYYVPTTTPTTPSAAHCFFVDSTDQLFKRRQPSDGVVDIFALYGNDLFKYQLMYG